MRTRVFFVRLIEVGEFKTKEEARLLSYKGTEDAEAVTRFFSDIDIRAIYASPYGKAYSTLAPLSMQKELPIRTVDAFRPHTFGPDITAANVRRYIERQWQDFDYKVSGGESLRETQQRCIDGLRLVLEDAGGGDIVIGTHAIPLGAIVNYYQPNFRFEDYLRIAHKMPFIISMRFDGFRCKAVDNIDLFV